MTHPPVVSWDGVLRRLRSELSPSAFEAWLRPLTAVPTEQGLRLVCPSAFHRSRVRDRFLKTLEACACAEAGTAICVELEVAAPARSRPGRRAAPSRPAGKTAAARTAAESGGLRAQRSSPSGESSAPASAGEPEAEARPERRLLRVAREPERIREQPSFDNFVVGPCNALAREASLALATETGPGIAQVFLAAPAGLGKTHLSRAVAALGRRRGQRVLYASAETFTNEFMAAVRNRQMADFKRRYRRECDLLVVEDVGFFDGKIQTQLELFHTLQQVLDGGGRVLATGDRLPHRLSGLESRLRDRLGGGLVAEIETPDGELRREIVRAKAAAGGVRLPGDCLDLLVEEIRGSVRDLEGVLIQLVTSATLLKRPIDLGLTREALAKKCGVEDRPGRRPDPATVIRVVTSFFKITPEALMSRSRRRDVLVPRQLAMYLCRRYTDASLAEIGRALGRDHPAVKNAVERVERSVLERAPLRYQVEALAARLDELVGSCS